MDDKKRINSHLIKLQRKRMLKQCDRDINQLEIEAENLFRKHCKVIAMLHNKQKEKKASRLWIHPPLSPFRAYEIATEFFEEKDLIFITGEENNIFPSNNFIEVVAKAKPKIKN